MHYIEFEDRGTSQKKLGFDVALDEEDFENLPYPVPFSATWRITHCACYVAGASCFAVGSALYFPTISDYNGGGWLFTIGSVVFFYGDLMEWWHNNRVGCFRYRHYSLFYENIVSKYFEPPDTWLGRWQRAENGVNFFYSLCGSTLYLIGSILFIPACNGELAGTYLFIVGSIIIFTSQIWKVYRAGCFDEENPKNRVFNWRNLTTDIPGFIIESSSAFGGLAYLIGCILFLPQYDTNEKVSRIAAAWFELGSLIYCVTSMTLFYRYFFVSPT